MWDGYWVEPDDGVYDRIDPYWIDFEMILVPARFGNGSGGCGADHGVEFFNPSRLCEQKPQVRVSGVFSGRIEKVGPGA